MKQKFVITRLYTISQTTEKNLMDH